MAKKKWSRKPKKMTPEQERNAYIFRLRGFYANACTLPFEQKELNRILQCVDMALSELGATTQTDYMREKKQSV